jgi:hypothetical protein
MPTILWVWDVSTQAQVALIVQKLPIKVARWQPDTPANSPVLIYCSGNSTIFTWSPKGCGCIDTPFGQSLVNMFSFLVALLITKKKILVLFCFVLFCFVLFFQRVLFHFTCSGIPQEPLWWFTTRTLSVLGLWHHWRRTRRMKLYEQTETENWIFFFSLFFFCLNSPFS